MARCSCAILSSNTSKLSALRSLTNLFSESIAETLTMTASTSTLIDFCEASSRPALRNKTNPNGSHALARYSLFLSALEQHDDALKYANEAQRLDPVRPTVRFVPAMALFYARRYDEAIQAFQALVNLPPFTLTATDRIGLGRAYAARQRFPLRPPPRRRR